MKREFEETWELPEYIDMWVGQNKRRLRMRLGQFTSRFTKENMNRELSDLKNELDELSDYELGEQFIYGEMAYINPTGFKQWYPGTYILIQKYGEEKVFSDFGFAIRGRIPYAYTRWALKDLELKPSQVTYEMAREVWG